jgi:hypothetical protein
MRKNLRNLLTATTVLFLITGTIAAQEIGATFDPEPNIDGFFEYTVDDWKFIGDAENERTHVLSAVYSDGTPNMLRIHLETEYGLNTQSN